jgi:hypothetical protein
MLGSSTADLGDRSPASTHVPRCYHVRDPAEDGEDTTWDGSDGDWDDSDGGIGFDENDFEELQDLENDRSLYHNKERILEQSKSLTMPNPENASPPEATATHNAAEDDDEHSSREATDDDDSDDDSDDDDDDVDFDEREFEELQQRLNFGMSQELSNSSDPEKEVALESCGSIEPDNAIATQNATDGDDEDSTSEDANDDDDSDDDSDGDSDDDVDFDEREFQELQQLVNFGLSLPTKGMRLEKSNSLPMPNPENDLLPEATALESRGRIEPDELLGAYNAAEDYEDLTWDDSSDDDDDDDEDVDIHCYEKESVELQQVAKLGSSSHTRAMYFL